MGGLGWISRASDPWDMSLDAGIHRSRLTHHCQQYDFQIACSSPLRVCMGIPIIPIDNREGQFTNIFRHVNTYFEMNTKKTCNTLCCVTGGSKMLLVIEL
jgi:hypothetical protein